MATVEFPYEDGNPRIPVTISGNNSLEVSGYVDTGATDIVIPPELTEKADIRWLGEASALTVGGIVAVDVYHGTINVHGNELKTDFIVRDLPENEVLIGRAVLDRYRVTFDGPEQRIEIHAS